MLKIGNKEFDKLKGMAPLAGITDSSFRKIVREKGCQLSFTEMVSAKGIFYNDPKTHELLHIDKEEGLVGVCFDDCGFAAAGAASSSGLDLFLSCCGFFPALTVETEGAGVGAGEGAGPAG